MSLNTIPDFPQCCNCAHMKAGSCEAFGSRIPDDIWNNRADHRLPFAGDGGLRWEPRQSGLKHIRDIWREAYGVDQDIG